VLTEKKHEQTSKLDWEQRYILAKCLTRTNTEVQAFSSADIVAKWKDLFTTQKGWIIPTQIALLTQDQLSTILANRTPPAQIKMIPTTGNNSKIQGLKKDELTSVLANLTADQVKAIPTTGDLCKVQDLTKEQVASIFVNMSDPQKIVLVDTQMTAKQKTAVDILKKQQEL
jgi:hypothetical protein